MDSLSSGNKIYYWNRKAKQVEVESVYGDKVLRLGYTTSLGQFLMNAVFSRAWFSKLYGVYQSSLLSRCKISPFIKKFQIPIEEFEDKGFSSFNDFFIRKFRPGVRAFSSERKSFPAFCEARYFAFQQVSSKDQFLVKGIVLTSLGLLGQEGRAYVQEFEGGPLLLARLCPVDYHRFHFPDHGKVLKTYTVRGSLHSVNPIALQYKNDIFLKNERQVTLLETENFGRLLYVEVGAAAVGKIVQTYFNKGLNFKKGEEKGYFLFGGSTVIVMGQVGKWQPSSDLLSQTQAGYETFVQLGEQIAHSI